MDGQGKLVRNVVMVTLGTKTKRVCFRRTWMIHEILDDPNCPDTSRRVQRHGTVTLAPALAQP